MPFGLYLHIPFCRKRCHFCYFRVYTNKNASEVEQYLDLLTREWDLMRQQAALEGLRQFQKQMKESQQRKGKGRGLPLPMGMGSGRGQGNGQDPRDKVEIPDEEAYQAPREFRKDLLDAMKEGTPEKYRDQVKRYYEELVK